MKSYVYYSMLSMSGSLGLSHYDIDMSEIVVRSEYTSQESVASDISKSTPYLLEVSEKSAKPKSTPYLLKFLVSFIGSRL